MNNKIRTEAVKHLFEAILTLEDEEECFHYAIPYQNQVRDVHPPLFYMFLHTACSIIPGEFSYFAGAAFNVVFFVGTTIVLYFLGKELFRTYLAESYAICSEISNNNKFLAIGQIDYSGTIVKSVVQLISIEKANSGEQNSEVYTLKVLKVSLQLQVRIRIFSSLMVQTVQK